MATKMTYVSVLNTVLANADFLSAEETEKLQALIGSLERKASADRKPTAQQKENIALKARIAETLEPAHLYKASEVAEIMGISLNKAVAMLGQMVTEGTIAKQTDKRTSLFSLVG